MSEENEDLVAEMEGDEVESFPLAQKHFRTFINECKYWGRIFNLSEWEFHFGWMGADVSMDAGVLISANSKDASFYVAEEISRPPTEYFLRKLAFHEACHVMLFDLSRISSDYDEIDDDIVTEREHAIIRKLENTIYEKRYKELNRKRKNGKKLF